MLPEVLCVGVLHLASRVGDLEGNRALLIGATRQAADAGADWVISGELVVSGYEFEPTLGTDWIGEEPSGFLFEYGRTCAEFRIAGFVSHPERDPATGLLHNSMFAFDRDGTLAGRHRKLRPVPVAEAWASLSNDLDPVVVDGISVGMLVCAERLSDPLCKRQWRSLVQRRAVMRSP